MAQTFTGEDLKARATDLGDGWSQCVLVLEAGDVAPSGVSTKYDWQGPGTVTYLMHAAGWTVTPDGVTRRHR